MTRGERLIKLRKFRNLTQEELAERLEVTQGTITKLENNKAKKSVYLPDICKILNCDLEWLETGKGTPPYTDEGAPSIPKGYVPIFSWHYVKERYLNNAITPSKETKFIPLVGNGSEACYALKIKNDSMISIVPGKRSFIENNIIIIDPEKQAYNGDYVIVFEKDAEEVIFKQYMIEGKNQYFRSLNPQYPIIKLRETTKICGVVIANLDIID